MKQTSITYEQVAAAADALAEEGKQPSIRSVRERLNSGSHNAINKFLNAWQEARTAVAPTAPELPQAIVSAIAAELNRAIVAARSEVEGQLGQAREEAAALAAAGEMLEAKRDGLAKQNAILTSERDMLAGKVAQLTNSLAETHGRIEREQQAAEAARIELATARVRVEQQEKAETALAATNEKLCAALDHEKQAHAAAVQQVAVLTAKLEASIDNATQAEARSEKALKLYEKLREQAAKQARQLEGLKQQQGDKKASSKAEGEKPTASRLPKSKAPRT